LKASADYLFGIPLGVYFALGPQLSSSLPGPNSLALSTTTNLTAPISIPIIKGDTLLGINITGLSGLWAGLALSLVYAVLASAMVLVRVPGVVRGEFVIRPSGLDKKKKRMNKKDEDGGNSQIGSDARNDASGGNQNIENANVNATIAKTGAGKGQGQQSDREDGMKMVKNLVEV
jgi:hypothetical protein